MGNAPLDRDTQIALMTTVKDRREARVERWKNDETVKGVLRQPAERPTDGYSSSRTNIKLKHCA